MRIDIDGKTLDLDSDFGMDIEMRSPIFNDDGSQSLPLTVPPTPHNTAALGWPQRPDSVTPPRRRCVIHDGAMTKSGVANITEANGLSGITMNIGFDNAEAYDACRNRRLKDLSVLPVKEFDTVNDTLAEVNRLFGFADSQTDDMAVFPVLLSDQTVNGNHYYEWLNVTSHHGQSLTWSSQVDRVINESVTTVSVPDGYGISPMLRAWRVLDLVFADLGVEIEDNVLRSDRELSRLVVLNNVADACCVPQIRYADLLPDCTVADFLQSLWVRFGLVYTVDFDNGTARVSLLRDILRSGDAEDLTEWMASVPTIGYESPQYVKLSAATSIDGAAPPAERFVDFLAGRRPSDIKHAGAGAIYSGETYYPARLYQLWTYGEGGRAIGSCFFNWDPQPEGIECMDLASTDECVSLVRLTYKTTIPVDSRPPEVAPNYLVGSRHVNTTLKSSAEDTENVQTPLAFMLAYTLCDDETARVYTIGRLGPAKGFRQYYTVDGETPRMTLLFDFAGGHYDLFWREYDALLREGMRTVTCDMLVPKASMWDIDVFAPARLRGVRCLVDMLTYSLPSGKDVPTEARLRIAQLRGDAATVDVARRICEKLGLIID